MRFDFRAHADAGVTYRQRDVRAYCCTGVCPHKRFIENRVRSRERQRSALRHRVARIDGEVDDHLFQLTRISSYGPDIAGWNDNEVDLSIE